MDYTRTCIKVGVDLALVDAGWESEILVEQRGILEWKRSRPKDLEW